MKVPAYGMWLPAQGAGDAELGGGNGPTVSRSASSSCSFRVDNAVRKNKNYVMIFDYVMKLLTST